MASQVLDPPLDVKTEVMLAQLTSLVYARTRGKSETTREVEEWIPDYGPPDPEQTLKRVKAALGIASQVRKGR
jgi:hypothetical protein